jgi:hypothetical protein
MGWKRVVEVEALGPSVTQHALMVSEMGGEIREFESGLTGLPAEYHISIIMKRKRGRGPQKQKRANRRRGFRLSRVGATIDVDGASRSR